MLWGEKRFSATFYLFSIWKNPPPPSPIIQQHKQAITQSDQNCGYYSRLFSTQRSVFWMILSNAQLTCEIYNSKLDWLILLLKCVWDDLVENCMWQIYMGIEEDRACHYLYWFFKLHSIFWDYFVIIHWNSCICSKCASECTVR